MKKKLIYIIGLLMISGMGWLIYSGVGKLEKKDQIISRYANLAELLKSLDHPDLADASIATTVLVYFSSECDHCKWEIQKIAENIDDFSTHRLLLVSLDPEQQAIEFLEKHQLRQFYLNAPAVKVADAFVGGVPQIFTYRDNELIKHFHGEVKLEAIFNTLN